MIPRRILFSITLLFCIRFVHSFNESFNSEVYNVISNTVSIRSLAQNIVNNHEKSVNPECIEDFRDFLSSFGQQWTLKMLDSAGKLPHGILKYNLNSLGQHAECIEISNKKTSGRVMRGQHCLLETTIFIPKTEGKTVVGRNYVDVKTDLINAGILPDMLRNKLDKQHRDDKDDRTSISINIAVCLPSSCKASEINAILKADDISTAKVVFQISEPTCSMEKSIEFTPGDIGAITLFSVIGFIMICSTAYDLWFKIIKKGDEADRNQLYIAFSVYTNSKRLFTPSKNPGPLACLHGIRSLSLMWVVIGHRYTFAIISFENVKDFMDWTSDVSSALLLGATVSVDSFFLMSGLLVSYTFFRTAKLKNIGRELPIFYIHRIFRLTPLLAVAILLHGTLLTHTKTGPYRFILDIYAQGCKEYWWTTLLYVNNYVHTPACVPQTWYLSVDMQLFLLSPLILYPLLWNKKIGLIWMSIWIAAAQATTFTIAYINGYSGGILLRDKFENYHKDFYNPTHTRAVPYLIGLLAGYLLCESFRKHKITTIQYNFLKQPMIKQLLLITGWLVSLATISAVVFGTHPLDQPSHKINHWEDTVFVAFSRTAWAVGLLWIIVACGYGFGGPINWFLSLRMWEILGRFSYAIYLTHAAEMCLLIYTANYTKLFTHTLMIIDFFGDMILSFAVSYLLILGFESPIVVLEKLLFKTKKAEKTELNLPTQNDDEVQKKGDGLKIS